MRHLGPLLELPLEQFLLDPHIVATSSARTSNKRPHSPGNPSQYSPAKRRILHDEGIFTATKTTKTPLLSESGRFAPSHFNRLLSGPGSPARKLEFGMSSKRRLDEGERHDAGRKAHDSIPDASVLLSSTKLAPSPKLVTRRSVKPSSTSSNTHEPGMDIYCSPQRQPTTDREAFLSPCQSTLLPNRQPHHYPGFDVYQDTRAVGSEVPSSPPTEEKPFLSAPHQRVRRDKESEKENMPPRRKPVKSVKSDASHPASTAWEKAGLLSPHVKRSVVEDLDEPMQITPKPKKIVYSGLAKGRGVCATPTRQAPGGITSPGDDRMLITPGRTPLGKDEVKLRRQALEDEVDGLCATDSDEEMMI
ncbi:hypothetical protein CERSUDRAFT_91670 [Gelatoporia subvermispora B]|uniref:Uncharacterized protein n=1 Tax=Ceriporiopsis subvermispora (strain B) TaxID=914234 RepID=M2RR61_CERS8|nr:hypothetical protein CERSUDRAFT_91670 [Gelatoporia subvermispora B]